MKRKKVKKHAIMAIAINKKLWLGVPLILMILCIGWLGMKTTKFFMKSKDSTFYESCIGYSTDRKAVDLPDIDIPGFSYNKFLMETLPVFDDESENVTVLNLSEPEPEQKSDITKENINILLPHKKDSKIFEKSIVSQNITITNSTNYKPDINAIASQNATYNATGENVKVLIMHTHGCETYSTDKGDGLGKNGEYRTIDTECNVTSVGEVIAKTFESKGINVIHDQTLCDYPEYNESYKVSLDVINSYLEKYPSIEFVFDIHRDAVETKDGTPTKLTCTINGEKCAQAMIVCGTDTILEHSGWQNNFALAIHLQKQLENDYPGLMRPINLREERFNMHKTSGSLIIEIGTHANTLEEAKLSAKYFSESASKILCGNMSENQKHE